MEPIYWAVVSPSRQMASPADRKSLTEERIVRVNYFDPFDWRTAFVSIDKDSVARNFTVRRSSAKKCRSCLRVENLNDRRATRRNLKQIHWEPGACEGNNMVPLPWNDRREELSQRTRRNAATLLLSLFHDREMKTYRGAVEINKCVCLIYFCAEKRGNVKLYESIKFLYNFKYLLRRDRQVEIIIKWDV